MATRESIEQKLRKLVQEIELKYLPKIQSEIAAYEANNGVALDLTDYQNVKGFWTTTAGNPDNDLGMDGSSNFYASVSPISNVYTFGVNTLQYNVASLQLRVQAKFDHLADQAFDKGYIALYDVISYSEDLFVSRLKGEAGLYGQYNIYTFNPDPGNVNDYYWWVAYVPNTNAQSFDTQFAIPGLFNRELRARNTAVAGGVTIDNFAPQSHESVAILYAAANGTKYNQDMIINYADGSEQVETFTATDWASGNPDIGTGERVYYNSGDYYIGQIGNANRGDRYMFYRVFDLNPALDVTSIEWNTDPDTRLLGVTFMG